MTDIEITKLLIKIYRELVANQTDLDEEAKNILYKNLWDMYD